MTLYFAVAGKGGIGKTTLASLLVRGLSKHASNDSVLAVDADPNATLGEAFGLEIKESIGSTREEFYGDRANFPKGMTKENYLQLRFNQLVMEENGYDLITMGRQEGAGCYCFINNILRNFLENLAANYQFVVIDNEAGLEHLSRKVNHNLDQILLVSDCSLRGLRTARRINELIEELDLDFKNRQLVVNRVPGELDPRIQQEIDGMGITLAGLIPEDPNLAEFDLEGRSLIELPDDSPAVVAVEKLIENRLL